MLQGFYHPRTIAEATALLAQDPDAKPIAGGATLVAMLNARPETGSRNRIVGALPLARQKFTS